MNHDEAEQYGREDARDAIDIARAADEPVTFITDNSYMPPIRAWGHAEEVWTSDDYEAWEVYVWAWEEELDDARVLCECPEYDNALYVVDLARWQYVDDPDAEMLGDEWEAITTDTATEVK